MSEINRRYKSIRAGEYISLSNKFKQLERIDPKKEKLPEYSYSEELERKINTHQNV